MNPMPVVLEGCSVRLEPLRMEHVPGLCAVGLDAELWRWTVAQVRTEDDLRRYVAQALELERQGVALPFATIERASEKPVGSTRYGTIDRANRRVEIGWTWLGRAYQRTALNTEAKYLMLRHAFEELGCVRVELKTDALNQQSRNAMRRFGAKEEGILRHHQITESGRLRDTVYYSVLQDEWPPVKAWFESSMAAR